MEIVFDLKLDDPDFVALKKEAASKQNRALFRIGGFGMKTMRRRFRKAPNSVDKKNQEIWKENVRIAKGLAPGPKRRFISASKPGESPRTHAGSDNPLKKGIFFAVDQARGSVSVGPDSSEFRGVDFYLHEHGGQATRTVDIGGKNTKGAGGSPLAAAERVEFTYEPRPYIRPSLEITSAEVDRLLTSS